MRRFVQRLLFSSICLLVLVGTGQVQAKTPTNVGLRYFTATPQADGIRLDWATETELNTAGFFIQRSSGSGDNFVTLDAIGIVDAQGGVATGATYSRVDETAVYGQTYSYKLFEIETDSSEEELETVTVTFIVEPTATPVIIGGDDNSSSPTQTPIPTSTPLASVTPTNSAVAPTATSTSSIPTLASPTPEPFVSPQPTRTNEAIIDTTLSSDSSNTQTVFAQEPVETAYPVQATLPPDTIFNGNAETNPDGQFPEPTIDSSNPTPYPSQIDSDIPATIAIIGSQENIPPDQIFSPTQTIEAGRGRVFLWAGFFIASLIFITGVAGSIILYTRPLE